MILTRWLLGRLGSSKARLALWLVAIHGGLATCSRGASTLRIYSRSSLIHIIRDRLPADMSGSQRCSHEENLSTLRRSTNGLPLIYFGRSHAIVRQPLSLHLERKGPLVLPHVALDLLLLEPRLLKPVPSYRASNFSAKGALRSTVVAACGRLQQETNPANEFKPCN